MPDTIATLGRRLAKLERRVTTLERARRAPYPEWRDLPLTGDTTIADEEQPPQFRANLWDTTEFCGRIGLTGDRATDEQLVALLPEGYWPEAPRTVDVASDATRRALQLDVDPKGLVRLRVQGGGSVRASWISLDSASFRTDRDDT
ncbi:MULTISPECIES: hypothetical protein [Streptomyces violaceusniger group]|uniref:Uncharacterized protein n=1 Tax=Streptomyces malaysiensis TaxID=92644 RepID=A0A2J7ZA46_STRMQ|nr:hypothetical protein [Streptomyces malaysiensis]PNG97153.1 hypothetical protein SMF913_13178 [Streptomyces malaysiensis]